MPTPYDFQLRADAVWSSRHPALFNGLPPDSPTPPGTYWDVTLDGVTFDDTSGVEIPYLTGARPPPTGYSYHVAGQMAKAVLPAGLAVKVSLDGATLFDGIWPPSSGTLTRWYFDYGVPPAQYAASGIPIANIVFNATASPTALDLDFLQINILQTDTPPPPLPIRVKGWRVGTVAMAGAAV